MMTPWRGALMSSLICSWINAWVNNREAGDLRRHRAHYDVIIMWKKNTIQQEVVLQHQGQGGYAWQLLINYGRRNFRHDARTMMMQSIKAACLWECVRSKAYEFVLELVLLRLEYFVRTRSRLWLLRPYQFSAVHTKVFAHDLRFINSLRPSDAYMRQ